jgi:hypothetical protein
MHIVDTKNSLGISNCKGTVGPLVVEHVLHIVHVVVEHILSFRIRTIVPALYMADAVKLISRVGIVGAASEIKDCRKPVANVHYIGVHFALVLRSDQRAVDEGVHPHPALEQGSFRPSKRSIFAAGNIATTIIRSEIPDRTKCHKSDHHSHTV